MRRMLAATEGPAQSLLHRPSNGFMSKYPTQESPLQPATAVAPGPFTIASDVPFSLSAEHYDENTALNYSFALGPAAMGAFDPNDPKGVPTLFEKTLLSAQIAKAEGELAGLRDTTPSDINISTACLSTNGYLYHQRSHSPHAPETRVIMFRRDGTGDAVAIALEDSLPPVHLQFLAGKHLGVPLEKCEAYLVTLNAGMLQISDRKKDWQSYADRMLLHRLRRVPPEKMASTLTDAAKTLGAEGEIAAMVTAATPLREGSLVHCMMEGTGPCGPGMAKAAGLYVESALRRMGCTPGTLDRSEPAAAPQKSWVDWLKTRCGLASATRGPG